MKKVIIIPGLSGETKSLEFFTRNWRKNGVEPIIYPIIWRDDESFDLKMKELRKFIVNLTKDKSKISIIGCSAGGSMALNIFLENPDVIDRAVNICGRIRKGNQVGFRSFEFRSRTSYAFAESEKSFENKEKSLSKDQREKIMTIRPLFGDELVPSNTVGVEGSKNIRVPTIEHTLSIYMTLFVFKKRIIKFVLEKTD